MEVSPNEFIPFYNAGCHYTRIGDFEEAVKYLREAYEIAPMNVLTLIEYDLELEPLRETPQLKAFIDTITKV